MSTSDSACLFFPFLLVCVIKLMYYPSSLGCGLFGGWPMMRCPVWSSNTWCCHLAARRLRIALILTNGSQTYTISLSGAKTVQDVLNAINQSGAGLTASINAQGTGINVVSATSGSNFSIGENGGSTATELGIRTFNTSTQLADLNLGDGVHSAAGATSDFTITRPDGTAFSIDVGSAQTVGDVINLINNNADNQGSNKIIAQLNTVGNGIELVSNDTTSTTASFQVTATNSSQAAQDLGLIPVGATSSTAAVNSGGELTISGSDVNPQEVNGVFNTLSRLYTALQTNNSTEISRDLGLLSANQTQMNLAQSELGAREQSLQTAQTALTNSLTSLKSDYSNAVDIDEATAATNLTTQQTDYQASLEATALISKLSLFNYL